MSAWLKPWILRFADAEVHQRIIVSKDEDFLYLASHSKINFTLIWVQLGNCRTTALLAAFDRLWASIESCLNVGDRIIEIR
ncbi:MAG TPA: DUF5615 family PIN-like protein [Candidatus Angelobacter sp.]|jgi:predicted nuclease of predicted toxin-antitoxin system|nr:DUF5615 family PIN-like protein [Candidatus Angelobacter sp.]